MRVVLERPGNEEELERPGRRATPDLEASLERLETLERLEMLPVSIGHVTSTLSVAEVSE